MYSLAYPFSSRTSLASCPVIEKSKKHILSIYVASRTVKRNFACYFDKGYGIEDVHEIYPDLTLSTIESQYVQWTLNANSPNNTNVRERWKNIIENNDIRTMGEYVFLTANVFAEREDCSPSAASDILHKIFDRLSINPLLCAGFESEIFEPEALANTIMDIDNSYNRTMEEKILLERYNIVSRLNKAYRDSYNDHYNIKAGKKNIPESVDESDRDYFMSLIWNRFSRHQVMRNRTLSFNQSYAIKSGDAFKVALYFMVPYKTAVGLISRYKNKV